MKMKWKMEINRAGYYYRGSAVLVLFLSLYSIRTEQGEINRTVLTEEKASERLCVSVSAG